MKLFYKLSVLVFCFVMIANLCSCEKQFETGRDQITLEKNEEDTPQSGLSSDQYTETENNNEDFTFTFISDLSEYEKYMNPENRDEYLILINTENMLSEDYVPDDLTDVVYTRNDRSPRKMRECAEKALEAMFIELYANGYTDVSVTSAYRSYAEQQSSFNNRVSSYGDIPYDDAFRLTQKVIQIPGASEHQSGLCCDMHNLPAADISFAKKEAAEWLKENCCKFGFILRYPEDKTDITGISFEPWHFRFVGRYHAVKMYESGLCLEEYCEQYYGK